VERQEKAVRPSLRVEPSNAFTFDAVAGVDRE
jgi:hypothetical protein